AHG
ncbi:sodium ion-translocating decarboxylase, beta subunit, partial [Vibrio parahaemolyticus V-223/04]